MLINPILLTRKCPIIFLSCCYHPALLILLLITMNFTAPTHYFIFCASNHLLSHLNYQKILYCSICDKIICIPSVTFPLFLPMAQWCHIIFFPTVTLYWKRHAEQLISSEVIQYWIWLTEMRQTKDNAMCVTCS